jgi:Ca2+-transporting ATPase
MVWHSDSLEDIFSELDTDREGLTEEEAERRLEKEGENRIEREDSASPLQILLSQFQDNLIYLLIFAAIVSGIVGILDPEHGFTEPIIIFLILFFNGVFGFVQDYKAEKSIEALKKMSTPNATVIRDGKKTEIDSTEVVPGDIIHLEQGDAVPADARLIEEDSLSTDEAALTGESTNVTKRATIIDEDESVAERENMVFMNTHIVKGRGKAVVVETGMKTQVGSIAEELEDAEKGQTPFQQEVDEMGRKMGYLISAFIGVLALIMFFVTGSGPITIFLMAVSLLVAAIPESLPAIVTLSLALGSRRMLEKNALVRRLPVVEALGSVNAIVTDKTGTLTEGVMTVQKLYYQGEEFEVTGGGTSVEGKFQKEGYATDPEYLKPLLECGFYCNNSEKASEKEDKDFFGEPTEVALKVSGLKAGLEEDKERKKSIPFSSDRKRMTVIMEDNTAYMKGAPETVLDRCSHILIDGERKELTEQNKQELIDKNTEFASQALRVLGFARKTVEDPEADSEVVENEMTFLGLQGMIDPAREEVKDAVEDCRKAGISLVMATGDNIETAKAIGKELGFKAENAVTGNEVEEMTDYELEEQIEKTEIFARVSPNHKVRILEALQNKGMDVAMTGDGVNDAPALKNSDVGVAMGQRGTDVAKKSSDMILQDDNFATIRDAIAEGRAIYDNIRKVVNYLMSTNSAEVMLVFLGTLIGGLFYPEAFAGSNSVVLTAIMILWVNFATDVPPSLAMSMDKKMDGIMERSPRGPDDNILDKRILTSIAVTGPLAAAVMLPGFFYFLEGTDLILPQTVLFTSLALFEIVMIQMIRRGYNLKFWDNKYLILGVSLAFIAQLLVLYTPLAAAFKVVPLTAFEFGVSALTVAVFTVLETVFYKILSLKYGKRSDE